MPKLTEFAVEGLFGDLAHTIGLPAGERITIIHGANGVGKTTVLRIVHALFARRWAVLRSLPFERASATMSDGRRLVVEREVEDRAETASRYSPRSRMGREHRHRLHFTLIGANGGRIANHTSTAVRASPTSSVAAIDHFVDELERVGSRVWRDRMTGMRLTLEEVLDQYGDRLPDEYRMRAPFPARILDFLTLNVDIIETQRLVYENQRDDSLGKHETSSAITAHARDLVARIGSALAAYAETSQALDRSFPDRVLAPGAEYDRYSVDHIRDRYEEQSDRRKALVESGLLDGGDELVLPHRDFDGTERRVLWTYLDDVEMKLDVLADLASKVSLFQRIVNSKLLGKTLRVTRDHGYQVVADRGSNIPLEQLSSGEQHEIVLTYSLIFNASPGSLILIDEPELSLHVGWQLDFLEDLTRISESSDLHFIVATHSPQIINDRRDLTARLESGLREK